MESNEQTELTSKIETDSYREQTDNSRRGGGEGESAIKQKPKGLMNMGNSVVMWEGGGIREINGNGRKYNKK